MKNEQGISEEGTYHFWLEHQLAFVDIKGHITWDPRVLNIDALPVTSFADLIEFNSTKHLWVYQWLLFFIRVLNGG